MKTPRTLCLVLSSKMSLHQKKNSGKNRARCDLNLSTRYLITNASTRLRTRNGCKYCLTYDEDGKKKQIKNEVTVMNGLSECLRMRPVSSQCPQSPRSVNFQPSNVLKSHPCDGYECKSPTCSLIDHHLPYSPRIPRSPFRYLQLTGRYLLWRKRL